MTATYWAIGRRIVVAEQKGRRRANYGEALIQRLAADLAAKCGRGFGARNLFLMRAFYLAYPDILQTASARLRLPAATRKVQTPLHNPVLAAAYRTALPAEKLLSREIEMTRRELESRWNARSGRPGPKVR